MIGKNYLLSLLLVIVISIGCVNSDSFSLGTPALIKVAPYADYVDGCSVSIFVNITTTSPDGVSIVTLARNGGNERGVITGRFPFQEIQRMDIFYKIGIIDTLVLLNNSDSISVDARGYTLTCNSQPYTFPSTLTIKNMGDHYYSNISFIDGALYGPLSISPNCSGTNVDCVITLLTSTTVNNIYICVYELRIDITTFTAMSSFVVNIQDPNGSLFKSYTLNLPIAGSYGTPNISVPVYSIDPVNDDKMQYFMVTATNVTTNYLLDVRTIFEKIILKPYQNTGNNIDYYGFGSYLLNTPVKYAMIIRNSASTYTVAKSLTHTPMSFIWYSDITPATLFNTTKGMNIYPFSLQLSQWDFNLLTPKYLSPFPYGYYKGSTDTLLLKMERGFIQFDNQTYSKLQLSSLDITPPQIMNFDQTNWVLFNSFFFQIQVTDETGFYSLEFVEFGHTLYQSDITSGTLKQASFNFNIRVSTFPLSMTMILCDVLNNCGYVKDGDYYGPNKTIIYQSPSFPPSALIQAVSFKQSTFDVSNGSISSTLSIQGNTVLQSFGCYLILNPEQETLDFHKYQTSIFKGKWNTDLQMFIVDFTIFKGTLKGKLNYVIKLGDDLYSQFYLGQPPQMNAAGFDLPTLQVVSNGNIMGAFVQDILYSQLNSTTLQFKFKFNSALGLLSMKANLSSNINPVTRSISIDGIVDTMDSNGYYTKYIYLDPRSKNQYFLFTSMITCDQGFNFMDSNYPQNYPIPHISFQYTQYTYTNSPPTSYASQPVTLLSFQPNKTIDVGTFNRTMKVKFAIANNVSLFIDQTNYPTIFADDGVNLVSAPCNLTTTTTISMSFTCNLDLPFMYGTLNGFLLSLYGFMDLNYNFYGFTPSELNQLSAGSNLVTPIVSSYPVLIRYDPVRRSGEELYIYGNNLDLTSNIRCKYQNGTQWQSSSSGDPTLCDVTMCILMIPDFTLNDYVDCRSEGLYATNYLRIYPTGPRPYVPPPVTNICGDNDACNGHGNCTTSGCLCQSGWGGQQCSAQLPPVDNNTNNTKPETNITENNMTLAMINIVSLREINITGGLVRETLLTKWKYSNATLDTKISHRYSTPIDSSGSVNVTIDWFLKSEDIPFAGQTIKMNPYTVKFSINITDYNFINALNFLQLVLKSDVSYTELPLDCNGNVVDPSSSTGFNDNFLVLPFNDKTLYGRFQSYGLVDNRVAYIENQFLSRSVLNNTISTLIGVNIPYFSVSSQIDPDYTVLINSQSKGPSSSGCDVTKDSNEFGITKIIIVCVCGAVGLSLLIGGTIFVRKILKHRNENSKIETRLKNMKP